MQPYPFWKSYAIIACAVSFLMLYPLLHEQIPFLKHNFKTYNLSFSKTNSTEDSTTTVSEEIDTTKPPSILLPDPSEALIEDSVMVNNPHYTGLEFLASFMESLKQTKSGKKRTRIAYFGDSAIEGDLICMTFRDSLQSAFGGEGVGFVPITSITSGFRISVTHRHSDNWGEHRLQSKTKAKLLPGISGEYFFSPADGAIYAEAPTYKQGIWASYQTSKMLAHTRNFQTIKFYYGADTKIDTNRVRKNRLKVSHEKGADEQEFLLDGDKMINELVLSSQNTQKIRLDFDISSKMPVYGVSLESNNGVIVDNFSSRGISGELLGDIPLETLKGFNEYYKYDLIILQFGLNILNAKMKNYDWYENGMVRVIQHFKKAFPDAAILVVAPNDKCGKFGGELRTDPSLLRIINAERKAAVRTRSAFFNLFEAMGGKNSMITWADRKPAWANKDYTHFNHRGAQKASGYLLDFLLKTYTE